MKFKKFSTALSAVTFLGGVGGFVGGGWSGGHILSSSSAATTSGESRTVTDPSGRVKFTLTPIYDGTNFGTDKECKINAEHGFPEGDNNAHDGVVCYFDQIGYRVDYSVAPSNTPTVVNVAISDESNTLDGEKYTANPNIHYDPWCVGGTGLIHTGVDGGDICTMTFPASASTGTSNFTTYVDTERGSPTDHDYRLKLIISDANRQNSKDLVSAPTRVIGGPVVDPILVREEEPIYKVINGVPGIYMNYRLNYTALQTYKGEYLQNRNFTGNFNIDMSSFPSGTQVTTAPGWNYSNGNLSAENYNFKNTITYGWKSAYEPDWDEFVGADGKGKYTTNFSTFTPLDSYDTQTDHDWSMHITKAEIKSVDKTPQVFPNNFNGKDEPGFNKGKDYNTTDVFSQYTEGGRQGSVNNDWIVTRIAAGLTGSGDMSKTINLDKDGEPDYTSKANRIYNMEQKYWANISLKPSPRKTNGLALCDTFYNSTHENGQQYDTSRKPIVQWWDSTSKKYVDRSYKIYYGVNIFNYPINGNNDLNMACGSVEDTVWTKWSTTPTDKTNIVKVVFDGEQDWAVDNEYAGRVVLPFKPFETYPGNNYKHFLGDSVAISSGNTTNNWAGASGAIITIGIPNYGWWGNIQNKNIYAGNTVNVNYNNGVMGNGGYRDLNNPSEFKARQDITIDSCISNFTIPQEFKNLYDYTITAADFGPDGLSCTDDDVSDWKITTGEVKKGAKNDQAENNEYLWSVNPALIGPNWSFTIPAYVKGGTIIPIRTNLQLTNIKEKDTTDNIGGTDLIVGAASTVGQAKLTTTPVEQVGNDVSWTLTWFNTSDNNVGKGEFIDVLPYNGDNRGTKMKGRLTNIRLENLPKTTGATYYVTTAAPSTVIANVDDDSNKEGGSTKWCEYKDKTCIGSGEITAIRMVQDKLDSGYVGGVKIIADTDGNADNDVLENNLGVGKVDGFALSIPTTSMVENTLYDTFLSGNVYWDANNNGHLDDDEKRRFQGAKVQVTDNSGKVIKEVQSATDGTWNANNIPLGDYKVQIVDRGGNILSKWTQTEGATPTTVTFTMENRSKDNVNYGFYAKVNPGIKIVKIAEGYTDGGNVPTGSSVTWNYTVTNTGDTAIKNIKVTDSKGVQVTCPKSTLEVGESMVCKGTGVVA